MVRARGTRKHASAGHLAAQRGGEPNPGYAASERPAAGAGRRTSPAQPRRLPRLHTEGQREMVEADQRASHRDRTRFLTIASGGAQPMATGGRFAVIAAGVFLSASIVGGAVDAADYPNKPV